MENNTQQLELWIQDIQSYLYRIIRGSMDSAGFKFDKYNYSFHRKHGKKVQEFGFIFVNQFPRSYRISFLLQIRNNVIRDLKSSFFDGLERKNFRLSSIVMFMSDFTREDSSDSILKEYILLNNKDLFTAADRIDELLQKNALPLCDRLSSIEDMDNFFASN